MEMFMLSSQTEKWRHDTFAWIFRQQQQTQPNIPQPDTKSISSLGKDISYLIYDYLNAEYFHIHPSILFFNQ